MASRLYFGGKTGYECSPNQEYYVVDFGVEMSSDGLLIGDSTKSKLEIVGERSLDGLLKKVVSCMGIIKDKGDELDISIRPEYLIDDITKIKRFFDSYASEHGLKLRYKFK